MTDRINLIAKLKQQPRQGKAPGGESDAFTLLTNQAKALYSTFEQGGKDIVRASGFKAVTDAATGAYEKVNILEKQNRKLSESFGVNTMRAAQLSQGFDKLGKTIGVNTDKLKTYAGELKKLFPGQAAYLKDSTKFGNQIAKQAELMRNKLGLSAEVTQGFIQNQALLSKTSTNNFENINDEIAKYSAGLRGSYEGAFADITEGIGSLDAETAAVFGRKGIGNLSSAVLGAKKLGIELGKVLQTGTGFLDVEAAIGNELELQILGAKDLNVAAIQKARLEGDGLALTEELSKYLLANGEAMKENPFLLQKSAEALGFSNSELLKMYSQLKINGKLEEETANDKASRTKEITAAIANENAQRIKDGKAILTQLEEEQFLNDKRSETEKAEDKSQQKYAESINAAGSQAEQVMKLANGLSDSMDDALILSNKVVTALQDSSVIKTLMGAGGFLSSLESFIQSLKTPATAGPGTSIDTTTKKDDLFIPAGGSNTVISGPYGSFSMNPGDDILAAPNIRQASGGSSDTSALIAALQSVSFHVTNVFDGDKIQSSLSIRQGQTLNNINQV